MKETNVVADYIENVIKKSWTWERLTEEERERFISMSGVFNEIKGTDGMRRAWLSTVYSAFLSGVGYTDFTWRSTKKELKKYPLF